MSSATVGERGSDPAQWDRVDWEGKHLLMSLLDIEVPMIGAINGPAWRHSEILLLLGWNRGRYFLLTGLVLDAAKALELGLVDYLGYGLALEGLSVIQDGRPREPDA